MFWVGVVLRGSLAKAYFLPFKTPASAKIVAEPMGAATGFPSNSAFLTIAVTSGDTGGPGNIPTAIQGTHEVWPRDSMRIRPHKVHIEFGESLVPSPTDAADPYQEDTDRVRNAVAGLIRDSKFEIRD